MSWLMTRIVTSNDVEYTGAKCHWCNCHVAVSSSLDVSYRWTVNAFCRITFVCCSIVVFSEIERQHTRQILKQRHSPKLFSLSCSTALPVAGCGVAVTPNIFTRWRHMHHHRTLPFEAFKYKESRLKDVATQGCTYGSTSYWHLMFYLFWSLLCLLKKQQQTGYAHVKTWVMTHKYSAQV